MESPITRQLIFPGVRFNGGPGLHKRSAGITDWTTSVFAEVAKANRNEQHTNKKHKFILWSCVVDWNSVLNMTTQLQLDGQNSQQDQTSWLLKSQSGVWRHTPYIDAK